MRVRRHDDYWADPCPRCGHDRGWHGEGGCNGNVRSLGSRDVRRCGCRVGQLAIPERESR